jgi:hypothetical protein
MQVFGYKVKLLFMVCNVKSKEEEDVKVCPSK